MKRILLALLLALSAAATVETSFALDPIPDCMPCPPRPTTR
jgi:hypothetical protein